MWLEIRNGIELKYFGMLTENNLSIPHTFMNNLLNMFASILETVYIISKARVDNFTEEIEEKLSLVIDS